MSHDKHRSLKRRCHLLEKASVSPILTNCEGGMSAENPDLVRLARDGHLKKFRKVGRQMLWQCFGNFRTTTAFSITETGRTFLAENRHHIEEELVAIAEEEAEPIFSEPAPRVLRKRRNARRTSERYARRPKTGDRAMALQKVRDEARSEAYRRFKAKRRAARRAIYNPRWL